MEFKFAEEPEYYPKQMYFVDKMPSTMLVTAKKFGLPIIEPESNNNVMLTRPLAHTIYVFTDFENHEMFPLVEKTPYTWILSPTALQEISNRPNLELRKKPTYCFCMYPFVFYINCPENIPLMKRMVKLLKWMGGRFVLEPNFHTTHMITTSTLAKGYSYCYAFMVPILSPAWVEHCWKQRRTPHFDASSVMDVFRITAFLDLYIAIKGFNSEDLKLMEVSATRNGAVVVQPDNLHCTHLVFSYDIAKHVNISDVPTHIPYVVNEGWFFSSLEQEQRIYEDRYLCFSPKEIRKSAWAIMDADEGTKNSKTEGSNLRASSSNEDKILFEAAKKETQNMKRKYAFEELHLKEKNYLHCLEQLLKIQQVATDAFQPGGPILNQAEAKIIFGNVGKLVEIHKELAEYFEDILMNWQNDAVTVRQVIMLKDEILKQYVTYTSNYSESKALMEMCEIKNKRFRKLLESSMKTTNKEHPKHLFIRPIQRLCSLVLQLQGMGSINLTQISRNTRKDNPDKEVLNEAIRVVKDVLQKINNSQELVEKLKCIFDIHHRIKNCPPDLVTCHREFIVQFPAQEVVSDSHCETQGGIQAMLFLFNDIIEVTKIRSKSQAAIYYTFDCLRKKPYEHIASLPLSMVINVIEFEGKEESDKKVFGLNIKDTKKEGTTAFHCFQYSDENHRQLREILMLIAEQLAQRDSSKSPKDFILTSVPITRIQIVPIITKSEGKVKDKVWDLLKVPSFKTDTKGDLRKSLSCSDLIDPSHVL